MDRGVCGKSDQYGAYIKDIAHNSELGVLERSNNYELKHTCATGRAG